MSKPWTNHEIEFLREHYGKLGAKAAGAALGRTANAAKAAAVKYSAPLCKHKWTEEDVAFLRNHYPTRGSKFVATHVGSTAFSTIRKAKTLGVKYTGYDTSTHKRCRCCAEWFPLYVFPTEGERCVNCENLRKPKHWRSEINGLQRQEEREALEHAQRRAA